MIFRDKFRRLMADRNQAAVAQRVALTRAAINSFIKGRYSPRAETAMRLARALNVDASWLIDDSRGWPPVWINYADASALPHAASAA